MRSRWISYPLWAFGIAEGLGLLSALAIGLLGLSWRRSLGDALFVEGAILLVAAGVIDLGRSVTVAHIRALRRIGEAPPTIRKPGRAMVLVIAGLLMCLQGVLVVRLFPPARG